MKNKVNCKCFAQTAIPGCFFLHVQTVLCPCPHTVHETTRCSCRTESVKITNTTPLLKKSQIVQTDCIDKIYFNMMSKLATKNATIMVTSCILLFTVVGNLQ